MKYLIVGLGNIGDEYRDTRHNIGFNVVDALAKDAGVTWADRRYGFVANMSIKWASTGVVEAFYLHESQWQCCALLDAAGEGAFGECADSGG